MSAIPKKSRDLVIQRSQGRCEMCGGAGTDQHHRRGRAVVDDYTHSPANLTLLCRSDHNWAHAYPTQAARVGFIISRFIDEPYMIPFKSWSGGWVFPTIGHEYTVLAAADIEEAMTKFVALLEGESTS